jgi:galactose mutarotase-like enzyme
MINPWQKRRKKKKAHFLPHKQTHTHTKLTKNDYKSNHVSNSKLELDQKLLLNTHNKKRTLQMHTHMYIVHVYIHTYIHIYSICYR